MVVTMRVFAHLTGISTHLHPAQPMRGYYFSQRDDLAVLRSTGDSTEDSPRQFGVETVLLWVYPEKEKIHP